MKFGVFDHVDASGAPPAEHYDNRLKLVEAMDRLGFYAYHVAEHHGTPLGLASSPNVYLSAVAQRTKRLRFGPLVYIAALYQPMRLAEEIAMLDNLSHGRLEVGLGRGAVYLEQQLFGVEPETVRARYEDARDIVLQALTRDVVDFEGAFYTVKDFPVMVRPYQRPRPPLWYGISNPDSAVWAASEAVNCLSLMPARAAAGTFDRYREEWSKLGRDAADLPFIGVNRHIVVGETETEARRVAESAFAAWRAAFSAIWDRRGVPFPFPYPTSWDGQQAAGLGFAGTPDQVAEFLAGEAETVQASYTGCQMVFGSMAYADALRSLELFASEVAPKLG